MTTTQILDGTRKDAVFLTSNFRKSALTALCAYCMTLLPVPATAGTAFGIYDARTLAMGGASVASANNDNAQFYNAALLAFNDEVEEKTQDSRFLGSLLIPKIAESAITIEELSQDDPTGAMTRAVNDFNALSNATTAQAVIDVASNLDASLAEIDREDLFADIYFGLAVSEPGKFEGAGFFIGTRLLAGGAPTVSESDRAILAAYQEGLAFVASDGTQGTAHPELFDANGALLDPGNAFDSTVSAAGAIITEAGVAMSKQVNVFGQALAAGFSFKVQRIDTFEDVERIVDDRIDTQNNSEYDGAVNFDVGFVKPIGERWRLGLAIKDIIPHNYETSLGSTIRMRPRARLGAAYQTGNLQIAADVDLTPSEPLSIERPIQELAVGAEWALDLPIKLRAGYLHDLNGVRDGIVSLGVGALWRRLAVDIAYAGGGDAQAAAIQFGIAF